MKCVVQIVVGKKLLNNAQSRWQKGRPSRCTMRGPDDSKEEAVMKCMVQIVVGKKLLNKTQPLNNASSRWQYGSGRQTMHGPCVVGKKPLYTAWFMQQERSCYTMRGSGGSKEVAVMQCIIQVVVRKQPLCNAWSSDSVEEAIMQRMVRWQQGRSRYTMHGPGGSREETIVQCMVQVVVGKKPL